MASTMESGEDFSAKMYKHMMSTYLVTGITYGDRLGLFDILAKMDKPKTVAEIATAANMKERYVKEWICLMVVGDIVDVDSTGTHFFLPQHRRKYLTKEGGTANYNILGNGVRFFNKGFEYVVDAAKPSGPPGFPQEATALEFFKWMDTFSKPLISETLISKIIPIVPGYKESLESGTSVLSIGCGSAIDSVMLAKSFPNTTFTGIDIDEVAIQRAKRNAANENLQNINFEIHDAGALPTDWSNKFDFITSMYSIHDTGRPELVLKEIYRVLKPGGVYLMVEFTASTNVAENKGRAMIEYLYCASLLHCVPTSLAQEGGVGAGVCWGHETMATLLKGVGFGIAERHPYPGVDYLLCYISKK